MQYNGNVMVAADTTSSTVPAKKKLFSVDILKAIAVLLIINHCIHDSYVQYKVLSTGGTTGCSIFFFISGYTLAYSPMRSFREWFQKRIGRLFTPVLVFSFFWLLLTQQYYNPWGFWFLKLIAIYYIAFYFIRTYVLRYIRPLMAVYTLLFVLWFLFSGCCSEKVFVDCRLHFFFIFFMSGVLWRMRSSATHAVSGLKAMLAAFAAVVLYGGDYAIRHLCSVHTLPPQALLFSLVCLLVGTVALYTAATYQDAHPATNALSAWGRRCVGIVSALSLESYIMVPGHTAEVEKLLQPLFPLNIPLVVLLALLAAYVLRVAIRFAQALVTGKPEQFALNYIFGI